jgi:hypothetical protein
VIEIGPNLLHLVRDVIFVFGILAYLAFLFWAARWS